MTPRRRLTAAFGRCYTQCCMEHRKHHIFSEFLVLGIFAAVIAAGFGFAAWTAYRSEVLQNETPVEAEAPTVEGYRAEARSVMVPFLDQVSVLENDSLSDQVSESLLTLASTIQERLLRMRVPSSERDAHLSFVTLIDRWRQMISSSEDSGEDIESLHRQTSDLSVRFSWLTESKTL